MPWAASRVCAASTPDSTAGCIADQEQAVVHEFSRGSSVQQVRVPAHGRWVERDAAGGFQEPQESGDVVGETVRVHSSQANVQEVSLAEAPAVAFHVRAKVEFRGFGLDAAGGDLGRDHFELGFLGDHDGFGFGLGGREAGDRAEVSAGADDDAGADLSVRNPMLAGSLQAGEVYAWEQARVGAMDQVMVEFAAADAVTYYCVVVGFDSGSLNAAGSEGRDGLQHVLECVFGGIDFEF